MSADFTAQGIAAYAVNKSKGQEATKADKIPNPIAGDIAITDADGQPQDSGKTFGNDGTNETVPTSSDMQAHVTQALLNTPSLPFVHFATTANDSLTGLAARDGYTPVAGNFALVKNQTNGDNSVYRTTSTAWVRQFYNSSTGAWNDITSQTTYAELNINGGVVNVLNGTANKNLQYQFSVVNPSANFGNTIVYVTATTKLPPRDIFNGYVSNNVGNNTNFNGTAAFPYLTVSQDLAGASFPHITNIAPSGSTYTETMSITSGQSNFSLIANDTVEAGKTQFSNPITLQSGNTRYKEKGITRSTGASTPIVIAAGNLGRHSFENCIWTTSGTSLMSIDPSVINWVNINNIDAGGSPLASIPLPNFTTGFTFNIYNQTRRLPFSFVSGATGANCTINVFNSIKGAVVVPNGFTGTLNYYDGYSVNEVIVDQTRLNVILADTTLNGFYAVSFASPTGMPAGCIFQKISAGGLTANNTTEFFTTGKTTSIYDLNTKKVYVKDGSGAFNGWFFSTVVDNGKLLQNPLAISDNQETTTSGSLPKGWHKATTTISNSMPTTLVVDDTIVFIGLTADSAAAISGTKSVKIVAKGGNPAGVGMCSDIFTVPAYKKYSIQTITFGMSQAAISAGYTVFLYDVLNSKFITATGNPNSGKIEQLNGEFATSFQLTDSTQYRLCLFTTAAVASDATLIVDDFVMGNQVVSTAVYFEDWKDIPAPTIKALTTDPTGVTFGSTSKFKIKKEGKTTKLSLRFVDLRATTAGSSSYYIDLLSIVPDLDLAAYPVAAGVQEHLSIGTFKLDRTDNVQLISGTVWLQQSTGRILFKINNYNTWYTANFGNSADWSGSFFQLSTGTGLQVNLDIEVITKRQTNVINSSNSSVGEVHASGYLEVNPPSSSVNPYNLMPFFKVTKNIGGLVRNNKVYFDSVGTYAIKFCVYGQSNGNVMTPGVYLSEFGYRLGTNNALSGPRNIVSFDHYCSLPGSFVEFLVFNMQNYQIGSGFESTYFSVTKIGASQTIAVEPVMTDSIKWTSPHDVSNAFLTPNSVNQNNSSTGVFINRSTGLATAATNGRWALPMRFNVVTGVNKSLTLDLLKNGTISKTFNFTAGADGIIRVELDDASTAHNMIVGDTLSAKSLVSPVASATIDHTKDNHMTFKRISG